MARALARGWGDPVLASDAGSGRAAALARELGGRAAAPAEVAREADVVLLAHKPAQLGAVAEEIGADARAVVSVLGGVSLADLRAAYPDTPVVRLMPNIPVEVGRGAICLSAEAAPERELAERLGPDLERLGLVVELPDRLVDAATAISGCGTAFVALVAEAQADSGVRFGLPADTALTLAVEGLAGAAAL